MQSLAFSLLASAELNEQGQFSIPRRLPHSDLTLPESGLYALIIDHNAQIIWRSPSTLGESIPELTAVTAGASRFQHNKRSAIKPFIYRLGSVWGSGEDTDRFLTFAIIQNKQDFVRQIRDYRETLIQWLGGGALLILLIHGFLILRELRPLKRVVSEIDAIERGDSDYIQGQYPSELALLTQRINRFILSEREQLSRYRHGLDDLAHSLKTPLAVIQGLHKDERIQSDESLQLREQIGRMSEIIDYQLKRAASVGKHTLGSQHTKMQPVIEKTVATLAKVYADKNINATIDCQRGSTFPGDSDDLYEIVGNISDNAYKWAKSTVKICCHTELHDKQSYLNLSVEDDGPGFSLASKEEITQRGVRADEQVPGQGIGLAVVQSIVRSYGAKLSTDKSALGGALVNIRFPLA